MTSNDREILIAIQGEVHELRMIVTEQGQKLMRMEQRQEEFAIELRHTNDKIDWIQHTIYWGFAILAIVTALCALWQKHSPNNDNTPAIIESLIELMRFTRESERH